MCLRDTIQGEGGRRFYVAFLGGSSLCHSERGEEPMLTEYRRYEDRTLPHQPRSLPARGGLHCGERGRSQTSGLELGRRFAFGSE